MHSPEFDAKFTDFHQAVLEHAGHEETDEFPRLRDQIPVEELRLMAGQLLSVESGL